MKSTYCKICGSTLVKTLGRPRISKSFPRAEANDYHIVKCRCCGFYYVSPEIDLSIGEWKDLYEQDYFGQAMKTPWQVRLNNKENKERLAQIQNALGFSKGAFLDMGCGEGYMLQHAIDQGFTPFACDIANNLPASLSERIPFFCGNVHEAAYANEQFTVIHTDSVLEHVPDPGSVLKELYRILKPGGILLIIVPNEDALMNTITKWAYTLTLKGKQYGKIKPFVTPYHINGFNKRSLKTLITTHGFQWVNLKTFGGNYMFWKASPPFTKSWITNLLLYPAGLLSVMLGRQIQLITIVRKPVVLNKTVQ